MRSWRDKARPIVAKVLAETAGQDPKAVKKALYDAYPFGMREYYPYKIWLDEIKRQRGLKPNVTTRPDGTIDESFLAKQERERLEKAGQGDLFNALQMRQ